MKIRCTIILLFCWCLQGVRGQDVDSLYAFIQTNPHAVCNNILYEGTHVFFSADEDNLLIHLTVANPQLQMRLLMMPLQFYIDPSGRKRRGYAVQLPSAVDVQEEMESLKPEATDEVPENIRPDIMPLMSALNKKGAVWVAKKQKVQLGYQRFYIGLNRENETIMYYVLIDKNILMKDKKLSSMWSFGIASPNNRNDEPEGLDMNHPEQPLMKEEESGDTERLLKLMQGDIKEWTRFSIDEVNNINIKE